VTTEPKIKPLVAFAAAKDGGIAARTIAATSSGSRLVTGEFFSDGWDEAERNGYRIIKVRIEPVEE